MGVMRPALTARRRSVILLAEKPTQKGKRPGLKITDAHAHIFPYGIAHKAADVGHFYEGAVEMWGDGTMEMLAENSRRSDVTRCFAHFVAITSSRVCKINDFIADCAAGSEGLFVDFATMHPDLQDIAGELDRAQEMGLMGVKPHPDMQALAMDSPHAMRIYEQMSRRSMLLIVHAGDSRCAYFNPEQTARVCRTFPEMNFQAAHLGAIPAGNGCWIWGYIGIARACSLRWTTNRPCGSSAFSTQTMCCSAPTIRCGTPGRNLRI